MPPFPTAGAGQPQPEISPAAIPSPAMPEQAPGMPTGENAPMTEEHRAELKELLAKVKQEYSKWRSMRFGVQNQANEFRKDQLKQVFQILQAKGVNLNDPKSVSEFLTQLKKTAPQHFDAITKALDYLLGADYETQQQLQDPLNVPPVEGLEDSEPAGMPAPAPLSM